MSRIVQFAEIGAPDVLEIKDVEIPSPGRNEVRIRVKALGLNRAESMFRSGQYLEEPRLPARLGYEAAGTVDARLIRRCAPLLGSESAVWKDRGQGVTGN